MAILLEYTRLRSYATKRVREAICLTLNYCMPSLYITFVYL